MRHLAQVQINPLSGNRQLITLADEQSDSSWLVGDRQEIPYPENDLSVGMFVLIKLDQDRKIIEINNATDWLLDIVQHYFDKGVITEAFIKKEQEKIETWRQEITAQSQDLTRRQLEIETRREQLEELEQKLLSQS